MNAHKSKQYQLGLRGDVACSPFVEAIEKRDWRIYADLVYMYNILVIEDTLPIQRLIYRVIENASLKNVQLRGTCTGLTDSLSAIRSKQPEIIIADIKLGAHTSFQIFEQLQTPLPEIIFISAYNQYAAPSFRFEPVDFLVKPLVPDQLIQAVKKAIDHLETKLKARQTKELEKSKVLIKGVKEMHLVKIEDIIRFQGDQNYSRLILKDGTQKMLSLCLKQIQMKFGTYSPFLRVHKSHLINIQHLKRILSQANNSLLIMDNGDNVPLSQKRRRTVLERLREVGY